MANDFDEQAIDRDALKELINNYGATIKVRTGAGHIIDLLPEHLDQGTNLGDLLAPKNLADAETKDNHDKIRNDTHDKTTGTHDKTGAKMIDYFHDSSNGVYIEGLPENQLDKFKDVAGEILKGRDLFVNTKE